MSGARNIMDTFLLEQDRQIVEEMKVSTMVGEGFVCLIKVSPMLSIFLLSLYLLMLPSPAFSLLAPPRAACGGLGEGEIKVHVGMVGYRRRCSG